MDFYRGGFAQDLLANAKGNIYAEIWDKHVDMGNYVVNSTANGYGPSYLDVLLKQTDFALMDDTLGVTSLAEYKDCRVIRIPKTYLFSPIAFGLPLGTLILTYSVHLIHIKL